MYQTVAELLGDSPAITSTIPAMPPALTEFKTQVNAIPGLVAAQAQPTTGATAGKKTALQTMADAALAVSGGVTS